MSTAAPSTMRAVIVHRPGGPSNLSLEHRAIPVPQAGEVLIRVHAFGLNRSEMFTRQGHSPGVAFPRILGIEATGVVATCPGGEVPDGAIVATIMGGMGRDFDGGYAEFVVVPVRQVRVVHLKVGENGGEDISWGVLGALPEMLQTAWGALFGSLRLEKGEKLLVRGGTSSVGLAAVALAKHHGAFVVATTRSQTRAELLNSCGADDVLIDNGALAEEARKKYSSGFDKVLELVGATTLADSLKMVKKGGVVCAAGIAGGKWIIENFNPSGTIPSGVYLTTYSSSYDMLMETPIEDVAKSLKEGKIKIPIRTYKLEQIVEAHKAMEESSAAAKMVVLID